MVARARLAVVDVEILIQMVEPYHGMSGSRSEKSRNEAIDWNELANPVAGRNPETALYSTAANQAVFAAAETIAVVTQVMAIVLYRQVRLLAVLAGMGWRIPLPSQDTQELFVLSGSCG